MRQREDKPPFSAADRRWMQRALELAGRGLATTDPNPRVGCVIVRDGQVLGEGWHQWAGEPHAEALALAAAGESARGATAYVTLEPCAHHGRTPPCSEALIRAGLARVVFGARDPNPQVDGRGEAQLHAAGIEVHGGLLAQASRELNPGFFRRMRTGRPWMRLKLAASLDGRTALASGASRWVSGEASREDVQHWRARSSAILTGIGTVLADDPRLDVRLEGERVRQPVRVLLDTELRTPPQARLLAAGGPVWIFTSSEDSARRAALEARGARIERLQPLPQLIERLGAEGMNEVHVEAGATLAGALLQEQLVDELLLYVAPVLLGNESRPLALIAQPPDLVSALRFGIVESVRMGEDLRLLLRPQPSHPAQG